MLINKRFRTTFVIFILLFSLFSAGIVFSNPGKAQDELSEILDQLEDNVLFPHPFRIVGLWEYDGNETVIEGDVTFDLYFSSTLVGQLDLDNYKDKVNISIYKLSNQSEAPVEIENGTKTVTLEPEFLGGIVQKTTVTIKNLNITLDTGDSLLFAIELVQSEKLLSNYAAKQYEKIKSRFEKIGTRLNESKISDLSEIGTAINLIIEQLDEYDIKGDDFGSLVNVFTSSAFCYGSNSYNSSISFSTNSSGNYTLYFQNEIDYDYDSGYGSIKIVNETNPKNDTYSTYPPVVNLAGVPEADQEEWLAWFAVWVMYNICLLYTSPSPRD